MRWQRQLKLIIMGILSALILSGFSSVNASSANISHSYQAEGTIPSGSLVSLYPQQQNFVQTANTNNSSRLIGVTVAANDSLLAVNASSSTVQVATSGIATALVSNVDGNINVGDQVAVSPFDGIGMKAYPGTRIIGLAQTAFNGQGTGSTTKQVKNKSGKLTDIKVGYIRVTIGITTLSTSSSSNQSLNSLQKIARSLTGRDVSNLRIAVSLFVAAIALIALITLVYSAIYASIVSVGRNPLAKHAVFRTLGSVLGMALLIAVVAGLTLYLLLR